MKNKKFKKGSVEAKRFMAKLRSMRKTKKRKVSGTKTHKDTKSHNVNIRVLSGVKKAKRKTAKKKTKLNLRENLKKQGLRMPHGYQIVKRVRITGTPPYKNPDAVREIQLYADNNSQLYFSRKLPILKNLQKKYQKGIFDVNKASKLWRYYIDDAMQRYHKEFGNRGKWFDMLNTTDRQLLANEYAEETLAEFESGNFVS